MRFKPPPSCNRNSPVGWRVEFRTTEVQTTDFENAAFVSFLVLLTRTILAFKLNLLVPISLVDDNMARAQTRSACTRQKFHFKQDLFGDESGQTVCCMSIDEIMNGSAERRSFPGILPLVRDYVSQLNLDVETNAKINSYLDFVEARANGSLRTTAAWMRDFVLKHPGYQQDSKVSDQVAYDLMWTLSQMSTGKMMQRN
jgi:glutamate--cysteine ligase catalytic subunit